jgi:outer membrane protein OmpA-like peptidoglycan-associated protein
MSTIPVAVRASAVCAVLAFALAGCTQPRFVPQRPSLPPIATVAPVRTEPARDVPTPAALASAPALQAPPAPASSPPAAAQLPPPLPFAEAVAQAATQMLVAAPLPAITPQALVIDPLVDGVSGMESSATRSMGERLAELLRVHRPDLQLQPLSPAAVQRAPWVLIGTFTPINATGAAQGTKDAYRICLALADMASGKIVAKGFARARTDGVDITPTLFYQESPTWMNEALTEGYIKSCQGTRAGDPINPVYLQGIEAAAQIYQGISAFQAGRYREAIQSYRRALELPQGVQLRALNGLYLAHLRLGDMPGASEAFGRIVDFGLARQRLAVKFLFRPSTSGFVADAAVSGAYPMWLDHLAKSTAKSGACLEVVGHTSRTGPEPLNERLSLLRAETVRNRLIAIAPALKERSIADGVGSRQPLVGLGTDDLRDALDRRVVFVPRSCGG